MNDTVYCNFCHQEFSKRYYARHLDTDKHARAVQRDKEEVRRAFREIEERDMARYQEQLEREYREQQLEAQRQLGWTEERERREMQRLIDEADTALVQRIRKKYERLNPNESDMDMVAQQYDQYQRESSRHYTAQMRKQELIEHREEELRIAGEEPSPVPFPYPQSQAYNRNFPIRSITAQLTNGTYIFMVEPNASHIMHHPEDQGKLLIMKKLVGQTQYHRLRSITPDQFQHEIDHLFHQRVIYIKCTHHKLINVADTLASYMIPLRGRDFTYQIQMARSDGVSGYQSFTISVKTLREFQQKMHDHYMDEKLNRKEDGDAGYKRFITEDIIDEDQRRVQEDEEYDVELDFLRWYEEMITLSEPIIRISYKASGGCNHHAQSDGQATFINADDNLSMTLYFTNYPSKDNNCFPKILIENNIIGAREISKFRKILNLKPKEEVTLGHMPLVAAHYNIRISIFHIEGNHIFKCGTDGNLLRVMLRGKHYSHITNIQVHEGVIAFPKLEKNKETGKLKCTRCGLETTEGRQHICSSSHVTYKRKKEKKEKRVFHRCTYDIEAIQEDITVRRNGSERILSRHVPSIIWVRTPTETILFVSDDPDDPGKCVEDFIIWQQQEADKGRYYQIIAHNGSRYDHIHVMNRLDEMKRRYGKQGNSLTISPPILHNGILTVEICGHKYLDSVKFIQGSLKNIGKQFECKTRKQETITVTEEELLDLLALESVKKMNGKGINMEAKTITPEVLMNVKLGAIGTTMRWFFAHQTLWKKYIDYCRDDVDVLWEICDKYVQENVEQSGLNPFEVAITLPSFSNKCWRKSMKEKGIEIWCPDLKEDAQFVKDVRAGIVGGQSQSFRPGRYIAPRTPDGKLKPGTGMCYNDIVSLFPTQMEKAIFTEGPPTKMTKFTDGGGPEAHGQAIYVFNGMCSHEWMENLVKVRPVRRDGKPLDWMCGVHEGEVILSLRMYQLCVDQKYYIGEFIRGYYWTKDKVHPYMREYIQGNKNKKIDEDMFKTWSDMKKDMQKKGVPDPEAPIDFRTGKPFDKPFREPNMVRRENSKMMMNSLYGKQLQRTDQKCLERISFKDPLEEAMFGCEDNWNGIKQLGHTLYREVQKESKNKFPLHYGMFILDEANIHMNDWMNIFGREPILQETDSFVLHKWQMDRVLLVNHPTFRIGKQFGQFTDEMKGNTITDLDTAAAKLYSIAGTADKDGNIIPKFLINEGVKQENPDAKRKAAAKGVPREWVEMAKRTGKLDDMFTELFTKRKFTVPGLTRWSRELFTRNGDSSFQIFTEANCEKTITIPAHIEFVKTDDPKTYEPTPYPKELIEINHKRLGIPYEVFNHPLFKT